MNSELIDIVNNFSGAKISVVGDLILDHYIWGKVDRISPEAPVVIVDSVKEERRLGGAGNVVNNLISLGASVNLSSVVGEDEKGDTIINLLNDLGVNSSNVIIDDSRQTSVKTRVIASSQQVVRVDRENRKILSERNNKSLVSGFIKQAAESNAVIVSDYAKGIVSESLFDEIDISYNDNVFGLSSIPVIVDPKGPNFSLYKYASVIKPNKKEAQEASGLLISDRESALRAAEVLLKKWNTEVILITLGEHGMVSLDKEGNSFEIKTVAQEVFDVSGAGDTVSAVFTLALSVGASLKQAAELSNYAAGVVLKEVGAVSLTIEELKEALL